MALAVKAVAAWASALFVNGDEAGGQQGAFGLELFDSGQEVAADQGRVFGDFHNGPMIADQGAGIAVK